MSNSKKAQERRARRNKLTKSQRMQLAHQHFGDRFVYQGRRLMKGVDKQELMKTQEEHK